MRTVLVCFIMATCACAAQDAATNDNLWSLRLSGGLNIAASESMKGTVEGVVMDASDDYIVKQYPFADPTLALGFGLDLGYRFSERVGAYLGFGADLWSNEATGSISASTDLTRIGAEFGLRAVLWNITQGLDLVGQAGIQANVYSGQIVVNNRFFGTFVTNVNSAFRIGAAVQAGVSYSFGHSPFAIDLMGGYANGNLIGKSFTTPVRQPNEYLEEIELNDGVNPNDPSDAPRVISLWTLRLVVVTRF